MPHLPIYLDYNATTPVHPGVLEAMLPYFSVQFGNAASSNHLFGWQAKEAVEFARENVAALIGAQPSEIVFTSGATEAINLAIKGVFSAYSTKGNHIITSVTEHKAVLDTCTSLEKQGAKLTCLPVNNMGLIDLDELRAAITNKTILICVMYANNETGIINQIQAIGQIAKECGVIFFCDATQAVGKLPLNVQNDEIDMLCLSAHKMYGPKGTGALYIRRKDPRVSLKPLIDGGGHERGMRSGTLNVPGIVGLGKACSLMHNEINNFKNNAEGLMVLLEEFFLSLPNTFFNGAGARRLYNTINVCFNQPNKGQFLKEISEVVAVSSGSACTSALPQPSHVLKAMGLTDMQAGSSLRFSIGIFTTREEVEKAIFHVNRVVNNLSRG